MTYLKHITSNLKAANGTDWSVELGPKTLIVGPNASFKTAVLQSAELLLTGACDDVIGRKEVKTGELLLMMTGSERLEISGKLEDGRSVGFQAFKEEGKVKKPLRVGPKGMLPIRGVKNALAGSAATTEKAFLQWVGQGVDLDTVLDALPERFHAKYLDLNEALGRNKTPVETLLAVQEYITKQKRDFASKAKAQGSLVEGLQDKLGQDPVSDEQITEAEAAVQLLAGQQAVSGVTQEVHDSAEEELGHVEEELLHIDAALKVASMNLEAGFYEAALLTLQKVLSDGLDQCPTCSSMVGAEHLKTCESFYQDQLAQQTTARGQQTQLLAQLKDLNMQKAMLQQTLRQPLEQPGTSAEEMTQASVNLADLQLRKSRWGDMITQKRQLEHYQGEVETYKLMEKALKTAISALMSAASSDFADLVSKFLPKEWALDVDLKRFRVGIRRNGLVHVALSGAEWATVTAAIAAAASVGEELAVLIPEDRAWDGVTLAKVMRALGKFKGQILMASTTRPKGKKPAGWTVINIEEVRQPSAPSSPAPKTPEPAIKADFSRGVLAQLGYADEDIDRMSARTALVVINEGLKAHLVEIDQLGGLVLLNPGAR